MNPKFSREVQKTTIRLLRQLAAVHRMPNVMVSIREDRPTQPIELYQKTEPRQIGRHVVTWRHWGAVSIPVFLSFDVPTAIAAGGSVGDLLSSRNKVKHPVRWDMEPLETDTLEQALTSIGYIQEEKSEE